MTRMLTNAKRKQLRATRPGAPNRLRAAMDLAHVTQIQLAERTGFTQSYISKVQNGLYSSLPGETMRTFAGAFGCAIEDLFPAREAAAS